MSIVMTFFLLRAGEALVRRLDAAGLRLAGTRGQRLAVAAARTVRGVVVGILGTAVAQGVLAGFGFWLPGVQAAPLLGFTTFLLSPVPIGPPLVWGAVGLALLGQGATGWGIFVLLWGMFVVSMIDNVIKPLLISQGSDLPFVLVLIGVLGGVVAFGFIGVFLGPVLLAIGYSLARDWSAEEALARMQASGQDADAATTVSPEGLPPAQPPAS
jgi:predicted PurR-regulated permease PerM